ncbi:MAG: Maf family protein [Eubacteriales bacterium]|nr:Maf family protein [Eubacteriales bacterium]
MKKIILASQSPRRLQLLQQTGLEVEVIPSNIEEVITETEPAKVVEELSAQKCESVAADAAAAEGGRIFLGSDTVVVLDQEILGKPSDEEDAFHMLKKLAGRMHQVYTGVTMIRKDSAHGQEKITFHVCTDVYVYPLSDREIRDYIATGEPMDKAGAYGIQGIFSRHIEKINGDYYNVVGLPVSAVWEQLKKWEVD